MYPVIEYQGEEISITVSISPPQEAAESNNVIPQNSFCPILVSLARIYTSSIVRKKREDAEI